MENSSFEKGGTGWYSGGVAGAVTIDSSTAWAGTKSAKIAISGTAGSAWISSDYIAVKPSTNLTLSGFVKSDTLAGNGACLEVDYYDSNKNYISYASTLIQKGTQDFTRYAMATTTPSNAAYAIVFGVLSNATGTAWFDNIKLLTRATTKYAYDANGNYLTSETDPLGNTTQYGYDTVGNKTSETDAKGNPTSFAYDSLNNLTQVTDALTKKTYYGYDPVSLKVAIRDARSSGPTDNTYKTTYGYNEINKITGITDPLGRNLSYTYDNAGNLSKVTYPNGNITSNTYDDANKLYRTTYNNEPTSFTYYYDGANNPTQITDNNSKSYSYTYDKANRLTSATDIFGYSLNYGLDASGNLTSFTDNKGQSTSYTYGSNNQLLSLTGPAGTTSLSYDEAGKPIEIQRGNGLKSAITYDLAGRVNQIADPGAPDGSVYFYDYDVNGNITAVHSWTGTTYYTYDALNRLTSWTNEQGIKTDYSYDAVGNLTTASSGNSISNGSFETYTEGTPHDDFADWDEWSSNPGFTIKADAVNYHQGATAAKFTNTAETADAEMISDYIEVDENQRYACYSWWKKLSGITFIFFGIQCYDQNKNLLTYSAYFDNSYGVDVPTTWNQLGGTIYRSSEPAQWPFFAPGSKYIRVVCCYNDWVGSAILDEVTLSPVSAVDEKTYTYNAANEITNSGFTYDTNGNLTSDGTYNYTYNCENQLKEVKKVSDGSTVATYTYNYKGLRTGKTASSGTVNYHYDDKDRLVRESDTLGNTIATYTYGNDYYPMSMTRGGATYFFHVNAHGDIISITDSAKNRVATYSYDPWGKLISSTGTIENPFRYAGYYFDSETGLYYLRSRYYSSELCRFLTKDKVDEAEKEPFVKNLYIYCVDNPANCVDPQGLWNSYVHYTLTKKWAYSEGFRTQCTKIASACNALDSMGWSKLWAHFASCGAHTAAGNFLGIAISLNSLTNLGYACHAKQDAICHGWIAPWNHKSSMDDWNKASGSKKRATENETKNILRIFKRVRGAK